MNSLKLLIILASVLSLWSCKTETPSEIKAREVNPKQDLDSILSQAPKEKFIKVFDYDTLQWMEIISDSSNLIQLDMHYATTNNFTKQKIYDCGRCFMRPHAGKLLLEFALNLKENYNMGVILYDCYRPKPYQQKLWDIKPDFRFVADPSKGSMHNRGMAIDIGLLDSLGQVIDMGTTFDFFGPESFHNSTAVNQTAQKNRKLLKAEMLKYGFKSITSEWWHYSYRKDISPISDWIWECAE